MDQKHAMLYPPIEPAQNSVPTDDRSSASAAMGLPVEPPPSYDMTMATDSHVAGGGWAQPSAPAASPVIVVQPQPHQPTFPRNEHSQPHQPLPQFQNLPATVPSSSGNAALPAKLGPNPCAVTCPACGLCRTSRMSYTPNSRTHLAAFVLCLVGWCCCACCVPYCMNSCRTGNHYCSKCNTFLGTFNPRKRH